MPLIRLYLHFRKSGYLRRRAFASAWSAWRRDPFNANKVKGTK